MKKKRVVLAYSGGLDTSVICHWLAQKDEVICCAVDLEQYEDFEAMRKKALASGAADFVVCDAKEEFVLDGLFRCMQAQARYEGEYMPCTAVARPFIMKKVIDVAHECGADAVAHGATAKGNDQVRFEYTVYALDPKLEIIAPWRNQEFLKVIPGRKEAIEYARRHDIPIEASEDKPWSTDRNIGHVSHEAGVLEDPWQAPPEDIFERTHAPWALEKEIGLTFKKTGGVIADIRVKKNIGSEKICIRFEKGVPIALNGIAYDPVGLLRALNSMAGVRGIGIVDMVENRILGMKSRGVYEAPGMTLLYAAYRALQQICLDKKSMHKSLHTAIDYGRLVYEGWWFTDEKKRLDRRVARWQKKITGDVLLYIYQGGFLTVGRRSPNSLYSELAATMERDDTYDPTKVSEILRKKWEERTRGR